MKEREREREREREMVRKANYLGNDFDDRSV